ncbi:hypothetical protein Xen7305DRAFT_00017190 [Xenococcus sp. PCC 7305]|uniref:hypothetical protein n=1 Tax=Xenococcus sp. PCC 7305 TaxID=102125 RepID=UPI0002ABA953|nr:hypothetical protein [Xenococcus sp. PCC 7305]ELS02009.1 hypothetical protein Xen7305DRAFT_00017190 [Xenococcus sp. PCC 7305]
MAIKILESFDTKVVLSPESQSLLFSLLGSESFKQRISEQLSVVAVDFTGLVFQPVPYSQNTPKGMPSEFETYHNSPDYAIINVPPNFVFKAKIVKPNRLCAIYRKIS